MRLREVRIKNFRSLVDVVVPIDDTTILVGENNSGKTGLLNAIRIALSRGPSGRSSPFEVYDYHMAKAGDSRENSAGITIELWFREDASGDWPVAVVRDLADIIQLDPTTGTNSIAVRLTSRYDPTSKSLVEASEFLNLDGQPLGGRGAFAGNMFRFLNYVRIFYLSAVRDSDDQFSQRSPFWGRILKDLKITAEQQERLTKELTKLNEELLGADPRIEEVRKGLENVQKVMFGEGGASTSIRALPLRPGELLERSEVVMRGAKSALPFPIGNHGQGMQSLAVIFLFQAFIDVLLKPTFEPETEAILTLEEPEAHLHPHGARALGANLASLPVQKIISTHSPYFVQEIPFKNIRLFRRDGAQSRIWFIKRRFEILVPVSEGVEKFCGKPTSVGYIYDNVSGRLSVLRAMNEKEYRELLTAFPASSDAQQALKRMYVESQGFLTDDELAALDTYAKRMRGEILFARAWLLCEGQSEYILLKYFAELLGAPLDPLGISVIDFKNNGSAGAFVSLARSLVIPWMMLCDSDNGGKASVAEVAGRGIGDAESKERVVMLPGTGCDMEHYLVENGFEAELAVVADGLGAKMAKKIGEPNFRDELCARLRNHKVEYAQRLVERLRQARAGEAVVPKLVRDLLNETRIKAAT